MRLIKRMRLIFMWYYNFNGSDESKIIMKINEFNCVTDYYKEYHYKRISRRAQLVFMINDGDE